MTVTPEQAEQWLETHNTRNRNMSETHWMQLAIDMIEGRWRYNGDAIRFGSNGVLLDGQHRLKACVEAKMPVETDVIFGLDPEVMSTIDHPKVRTAADIAHLNGVENAVKACALAHLLLIHRKHGIERMASSSCHPTKTQVTALVSADPRIPVVAGRTGNWGRHLAAPRIIAFCYYLFSEQDGRLADRFFSEFTDGANLSKDNPVYRLRERLVGNSLAKAKLPPVEVISLFFKAWIAYREGRPVKALRWRGDGGIYAEPFPSIGRARP
jgi:hypothetical protein